MGNSLPKHETVNGTRFGVVKHIAEGGFSNVFEVKDAKTKARYAMKRVRCGDPEAVEAAKVRKEGRSHALPPPPARHERPTHRPCARDHAPAPAPARLHLARMLHSSPHPSRFFTPCLSLPFSLHTHTHLT